MALSTLRTNLSRRFFKPKDTAENPQLYLKLTTKCMKQTDRMVSLGAATSPKFNQEQCKYLADKLKVVVRSAHSFFEPMNIWYSKYASDEERMESLEIFKLLFVLGKEVESFIQDCSREAWIQSAIMLTNVAEHTLSLSFDLEICMIVFSNKNVFGAISALSVAEVAWIRKAEDEIVEEKSDRDQLRLYEAVSALIQASKPSSADREQAVVLLQRLKSSRLHLNDDSLKSSQFSCTEISISNLKKMQELGKGAFGIVHKANWLGIEVARKTFHGPSSPFFKQEVKILEGLCHPNIVSLLWHTRDARRCYMVLELMDKDLYSLMEERWEECGTSDPPFSIFDAVHIMLQVAEGIYFLHEKHIVHRDLKSQNILVKQMKAREVPVKYVQVKVADFGLSRTKERSKTYSDQTPNQGTTRWMAPEMIKIVSNDGQVEVLKHPFKVDVYSFGMVCFEILTGDLPFSTLTPNEVKTLVLGGTRPQLPDRCPERLRCLIEACWNSDPTERPGFGEICAELQHLKYEHLITSATVYAKFAATFAEFELNFTLEQVQCATQFFSERNCVGVGSMSAVYRGVLPDTTVVAVKRLNIPPGGEKALDDGFATLVQVRDWTLVKVLGYCRSPNVKALVMEYMPNGNLGNLLYPPRDAEVVREFNWSKRFNVAIAVAQGLKYLHHEHLTPTVHGDLKPSNIKFNLFMEARIADFGVKRLLARHGLGVDVGASLANGYRAPELAASIKGATIKGDVYSFGIIVLEMVSGRSPQSLELGRSLPQWIRATLSDSKALDRVLDPILMSEPDVQQQRIAMVLGVALLCTREDPLERPYITEVLKMLTHIKTRPQGGPTHQDGTKSQDGAIPRDRTIPQDGIGPQDGSRRGSAQRLQNSRSGGSSKLRSSLSGGASELRRSLSAGSSKLRRSLSAGSSNLWRSLSARSLKLWRSLTARLSARSSCIVQDFGRSMSYS